MEIRFADFVLDCGARQLFAADGAIDLSSRSFEILTALLSKPGQIVTKSELFDRVWPGVVVEENTLQVHISSLRKLLGPDLIKSVYGRG